MTLRFVVYGQAEPAGSKRNIGHRRIIDANPKAADWKRQVAQVVGQAFDGNRLLEGALELELVFYRPRPGNHYGTGRNQGRVKASAPEYPVGRPDVLKLARGVEDALSGILYMDDAQIVAERLAKLYGSPARVEITVTVMSARAEGAA